MNKVENRISQVPEESQTEPWPTSKANDRAGKLRQARKRASGPYRCDWCGQAKAGMRRTGPRICETCWKLHIEKKRAK